ncbi:MAG: PEP-CTERM sorting domain-containing protein [Spartobacteria bacterium]|nr:PEP-CTERM sorting domain-containing protein [Spartobacteria bacterium]
MINKKAGYVSASMVTASGLLLSATPDAEAAIQYSGVQNLGLTAGNTYTLIDINDAGGNDLSISINYGGGVWFAYARGANGAKILGSGGAGVNLVLKYSYDQTVSGGWGTLPNGYFFKGKTAGGAITAGSFNGADGYMGFTIDYGAGTRYGWLYVDNISQSGDNVRIVDWAYEDSGGTIKAGDRGGGGGDAVPEPTGLALLACGAAGIYALRRKSKTT